MDMGISVAGDFNERRTCRDVIKVYARRSRIKSLDNKISGKKIISEDESKFDHKNNSSDNTIGTLPNHLNSVQEKDNYSKPDETLEIVNIEDLSSRQDESNETVLDQTLQIKPNKDLNSVQGVNLSNENIPSKSIIAKVDGRIRVSLAPARPRNQVRELKRKLEDELDQVRNLVYKLEAKKIQLTSYHASNGDKDDNHSNLYSQSKDVIAQARVNYDSRTFQNLSVQVFENKHDGIEFGEKEKRTPKENQYYRSSDFLLANDRLPPEGNKNLNTTSYGFVKNKHKAQAFKSCYNLLTRLMRHKFAWVFNKPVDAKALGLHDYHYIIRNPMDLGTIKSKLAKNRYKSPREFAEDTRLTFHNAMTYNPRGHDVYLMAEELCNIFENKWVAIESKYDYDYRYRYGFVQEMSLPTPLSRKVHPSPPRPLAADVAVLERPEVGSMPRNCSLKPKIPVLRKPALKKPKSKDPDKRDMTGDEKQKLSVQLQNLPSEKLDAIVQIVNRGKGLISQNEDAIELDIDSVDTEALWELDRLVTNYKKNLSKRKRRAEIAQARAEARPAVSFMNNGLPAITQAPKESTEDQNNAAAFLLPGERIGESSSSGTSSSDSDSDSDSSDSDTDSSSGYRSPKT